MQPGRLSSIFIPGIHEHRSTPPLFPFDSSQRFKSTKAASQHEHLYSTDDDGGDNSQEDITYPPFSEEKAEVPFLSGSDNLPARFSRPSSLSDYHHQNITWSSSPLRVPIIPIFLLSNSLPE
ncbi:hypothetical protein OIU74_010372 [Salix koriyanagi]|uniref:Uncharacterized protein n=1 Tax=Salix koriyanagi TaxID=2511006 RepID=A0A9Q0TCT3_9ROSI|nr:hypothetical protein OIU74_010372 [Salix koriyanagi]